MILKSIGVISCGKMLGALNALLGLLAGSIMSLIAVAGVAADRPIQGGMVGDGDIIFLPILYGLIGFIGGIVTAALCNILAGIVGGIEMEFAASSDTVGSRSPADW
jgi:hypothetical protein